jgi:putative flippase GtrA
LDLHLRQPIEKLKKFAVHAEFSIVGAGNAAVDLGTLNLLLWLWPASNPSMLALYNTLALLLANANSYFWNTRWTFRRQARRTDPPKKRIGFITQALLNVGMSSGLFWVAAGWLATTPLPVMVGQNVAKGISAFGAFIFSFLVLRHIVLKPRVGRQDV